MITSSFVYTYDVPALLPGDTRDPVIIDVDFSAVIPGRSKAYLVYLALIGMRQNDAGAMSSPGAFSARLLGDFESDNTPIYSINSPTRTGAAIAAFNGITIGSNSPLYLDFENWNIPRNFQIEFFPSNAQGRTENDILTMYFTIGYLILP